MAIYLYKEGSKLLQTIPLVPPPLRLTGVEVLDDSAVVTVANTAGVLPGMAWHGPRMKAGARAFVVNVLSATKLELAASLWDAAAGAFTVNAANAWATVDDNAEGNLATVHGFSYWPRLHFEPGGLWRNLIETTGSMGFPVVHVTNTTYLTSPTYQSKMPWVLNPKYVKAGTFTEVGSPPEVTRSDVMAVTPLKRHNGVPEGWWVLVQAGGHFTTLPATRKHSCVMSALDEADEEEAP